MALPVLHRVPGRRRRDRHPTGAARHVVRRVPAHHAAGRGRGVAALRVRRGHPARARRRHAAAAEDDAAGGGAQGCINPSCWRPLALRPRGLRLAGNPHVHGLVRPGDRRDRDQAGPPGALPRPACRRVVPAAGRRWATPSSPEGAPACLPRGAASAWTSADTRSHPRAALRPFGITPPSEVGALAALDGLRDRNRLPLAGQAGELGCAPTAIGGTPRPTGARPDAVPVAIQLYRGPPALEAFKGV